MGAAARHVLCRAVFDNYGGIGFSDPCNELIENFWIFCSQFAQIVITQVDDFVVVLFVTGDDLAVVVVEIIVVGGIERSGCSGYAACGCTHCSACGQHQRLLEFNGQIAVFDRLAHLVNHGLAGRCACSPLHASRESAHDGVQRHSGAAAFAPGIYTRLVAYVLGFLELRVRAVDFGLAQAEVAAGRARGGDAHHHRAAHALAFLVVAVLVLQAFYAEVAAHLGADLVTSDRGTLECGVPARFDLHLLAAFDAAVGVGRAVARALAGGGNLDVAACGDAAAAGVVVLRALDVHVFTGCEVQGTACAQAVGLRRHANLSIECSRVEAAGVAFLGYACHLWIFVFIALNEILVFFGIHACPYAVSMTL